jgi:DNA invertase Pin-like site-specific DNA recombinase
MHPNLPLNQVKIMSLHLERKAVIYIRQSSPKQVREHLDSQLTQRTLVYRAQSLGWHPERIEVFDGDLGQSATGVQERDAFKALAADVALGHVGIVFGWQVSRLARNNAEWYQLLDLAALVGTLIGDTDGVYDPRLYNDRLLLGLKGTMSEAELYLMRQRLHAGRLSKVHRGEYVQRLPTGLVRLADHHVIKDPDRQMQHVIALVFTKFEDIGSGYGVLRYCKQHDILLPRRHGGDFGPGDVQWRKPSEAAIRAILTNPAYAGAFVYGRRTSDPRRRSPGQRTPPMVHRPMEEWQCILQDVYPAYISWAQYLANQARLRENAQGYTDQMHKGRGAPREGAALLQGLATCGLCGHRMRVAYRPRARYICMSMKRAFAEARCAHLDGPSIEAFVVQAFFDAIAPAQLETLDEVLAQRQRERHRLETYHQQQVSLARYEATLARRRYEHVDPDYRLAAAELERAWEDKLRALRQAEEAAERFAHEPCEPTLTPERREQLLHLSQRLPALWSSAQLSHTQRKALLRSVIARVIVQRTAADRVAVKIIWVSGHFSQGMVIPPVLHQRHITGYATMVERIQHLWSEGYTDIQIAQTLSREGFRSARRDRVLARTVLKIRNHHHWVSRYHQHRLADKIDDMWTIHGLSRHLGVEREWFYHRIRTGTLREPDVIRKPPYGNYLIRDDAALLARLRTEVHRSRRLRRGAPTGASSPERGASPEHPGILESSAAWRARTSRTNRIAQDATSDA